MAIPIADAARQWRITRETVYRRQLAGELRFATVDPPTVEASEMLRVFGEPKTTPDKSTSAVDVLALGRVESICDALRASTEYLMGEIATIKQQLQAERDDARKLRDRLLEFLAAQKRLLEAPTGNVTETLQRGETAEAQAVFAAQQRVERHLMKHKDLGMVP